jgi:hypothetical protein
MSNKNLSNAIRRQFSGLNPVRVKSRKHGIDGVFYFVN